MDKKTKSLNMEIETILPKIELNHGHSHGTFLLEKSEESDQEGGQTGTGDTAEADSSNPKTRRGLRRRRIRIPGSFSSDDPRCFFCHVQVHHKQKPSLDKNFIFSMWNLSCANSICSLFELEHTTTQDLLENASYCTNCTKIIRDIDFTLRSINTLNRSLQNYKETLQDVVKDNYNEFIGKGNQVQRIYQNILSHGTGSCSWDEGFKVEHEDENNESNELEDIPISADSLAFEEFLTGSSSSSSSESDEADDMSDDAEYVVKPDPKIARQKRRNKTKNTRIFCKLCPFYCYRFHTLRVHLLNCHEKDSTPYHCELSNCEMKFRSRAALKYHKTRYHGKRDIPCTICGKLFYEEYSLKKHVQGVHRNNVDEVNCSYCSISCKKDQVESHEELHKAKIAENQLFSCVICPQTFTNSIDLRRHVSQDHNEGGFMCEKCSKVFKARRGLSKHMNSFHADNNSEFKCPDCSFVGKTALRLTQHRKTHLDLKFLCEECGSAYTRKSELDRHMMTHTGETPYKCRFCPKGFNKTNKLKNHEESHLPTKNYVCECGKAFRTSNNIFQHKRFHCHSGGNVTKPYIRKRNQTQGQGTRSRKSKTGDQMQNSQLEPSSQSEFYENNYYS